MSRGNRKAKHLPGNGILSHQHRKDMQSNDVDIDFGTKNGAKQLLGLRTIGM